MKKIRLFQISYIAIFVLSISNFAYASSFQDITADNLNSDAIEYVKTNGIVQGYANGDFKPDRIINRAEFTKIIVGTKFDAATIDRCLTDNIKESWTYVFFPDVLKDAWYAKYICVAKMNNIIAGYSDGNFKPNNNINFAEASKIIVSTFGYTVGEDTVWYKPFVEKLGEAKAIPTTITSFTKNITRGEMAEMVYRLKANITTKDSLDYGTMAGDSSQKESGTSSLNEANPSATLPYSTVEITPELTQKYKNGTIPDSIATVPEKLTDESFTIIKRPEIYDLLKSIAGDSLAGIEGAFGTSLGSLQYLHNNIKNAIVFKGCMPHDCDALSATGIYIQDYQYEAGTVPPKNELFLAFQNGSEIRLYNVSEDGKTDIKDALLYFHLSDWDKIQTITK